MGREVASKSIDGITDLVVVAPLKPGMIDAFENITHETRLKLVAEALHKIRVNAREHELVSPFADTAERILSLFNFRIGVLDGDFAKILRRPVSDGGPPPSGAEVEPRRYMFLVATFDGPFEPYMRLIWKPLGIFLDLLLCNCDGYKLATQTGFPEYLDWVRRHQVEPSIFYSTSGNTLRDQYYLADLEKLQRELDPASAQPSVDRQLAELTLRDPEAKALETWADPHKQIEAARLAFEALNVLYRLADFFPADRPEGQILLQSARDLLLGLPQRVGTILAGPESMARKMLQAYGVTFRPGGDPKLLGPYTEQWFWLNQAAKPAVPFVDDEPPLEQVQHGLLSAFDSADFRTTHALTLLLSVTDAKLAGETLSDLYRPNFGNEPALQATWNSQDVRLHISTAFTAPGLEALKMAPGELAKFPKEFRDGLFARAPQLGDVRDSHPRRWQFPRRFDSGSMVDAANRPVISSEEVDVVVQMRIEVRKGSEREDLKAPDFERDAGLLQQALKDSGGEEMLLNFDQLFSPSLQAMKDQGGLNLMAAQPAGLQEAHSAPAWLDQAARFDLLSLYALRSQRLRPEGDGLRLLALESSFRPSGRIDNAPPEVPVYSRDHFGFVDGVSQPKPALMGTNPPQSSPTGTAFDDRVPYGEVLCGYRNDRGDSRADQEWKEASPLLRNGSFMVLRKIAQFTERLKALEDASTLPKGTLAQALVGRNRDGTALLPTPVDNPNDFNFAQDTKQLGCPFSSHIRLANPRDRFQGRPAPRIVRRGMSYGPQFDETDASSAGKERGILFVAYNASLAEQYEVIQRWLNGANPTGVSSAANDPLTGARQEAGPYTFRFPTPDGAVQRVKLTEPLTQVRYGLYAFVPSKDAFEAICAAAIDPPTLATGAEADQGQAIIDRILAMPKDQQRLEWKRLIEDFSVKDSADLSQTPLFWRAIREGKQYKGVFRVASGIAFGGEPTPADEVPVVLVADWANIEAVLANPADFSSKEQLARTQASFGGEKGGIFVSMDPHPDDTSDNRVSRYAQESIDTNAVVFGYSNNADHQKDVFNAAYGLAAKQLKRAKDFNAAIGITDFFKIELRRDFLVPVLGGLCNWLFDIPDTSPLTPTAGYIDQGAWGWQPIDPAAGTAATPPNRKPRCPADFMAPSRFSFYPRPSPAIQRYGIAHGKGLYASSQKLVPEKRNAGQLKGQISSRLLEIQPPLSDELLARNIIGNMEGMLPPTDGIMRGIFFDWIDRDALWRNQSDYLVRRTEGKPTLGETETAIGHAVRTAMCKRPAPDLLYRTATKHTKIGDVVIKSGETVILSLVSPMLASLDSGTPEITPVFGGYRHDVWQQPGQPVHACPAYHMVMAMVYGMIAALFDAGRIVVQPASLILRISEFDGPPPEPQPLDDQDILVSSPLT